MYTLNITTKVDHSILSQWLAWQKQIHIPAMMATGAFESFRFCELLGHDESEGKTFIIQYSIAALEDYESFLEIHDERLRNKGFEKWGDRFLAFRTLMQNID